MPAIFANLLNFNAYQILELDPSERMKALLGGLEALPVELLFNTGPRAHAGLDCLHRWAPTQPSQIKMRAPLQHGDIKGYWAYREFGDEVDGSIRWTKAGDLEFSPRRSNRSDKAPPPYRSDGFVAVTLNGTNLRDRTCPAFITLVKMPKSNQPARVLICLQYSEFDEMQRNERCKEVILLDIREDSDVYIGSKTLGGCLFRLIDAKEDANRMVCQYDCPLTFKGQALRLRTSKDTRWSLGSVSCVLSRLQ